MRYPLCARSALLFLSLVAGGSVFAGEWHQSVSLPATVEHDTNLQMSSATKQGVTRAIFTPAYNLIGTYGADVLKADATLRVERSSDRTISMDREDPNLLLDWHRQTETGAFGLVAKYDRASSRQSQLSETGGLVQDSTRITWSLGGDWQVAINERNTLSTNAEYKSVKSGGGDQTNYTNLSAGVTWGYTWSERIEPFLQVTASHYVPERNLVPVSDNYTVQAGAKWKFAENWDWSLQGGISRVVSQGVSSNGWNGSTALRYLGPRADYAVDANRSVSPSGEGGFVQTDQIGGKWGYAYDELTRLGVGASWRNSGGQQPNTMKEASASIDRMLSRFWTARLNLQHKRRQQTGQPDASGNVAGLTLVYSHPDL